MAYSRIVKGLDFFPPAFAARPLFLPPAPCLSGLAGLKSHSILPFGAGPRICIGMAFAMIEATAMLATMLQSARFGTVPGHDPMPVARVTLVPKGGMPLRVWLD